MKIKQLLKRIIEKAITRLSKKPLGRFIYQKIIDTAMARHKVIHYGSHQLRFIIPNQLNYYRVTTFETKEPETLQWIDKMPAGSVFWDVGANIGLYSIYAAMARNCQVFAFEPSVFNLELLARNIFINKLQKKICIIPLALSDGAGENTFKMTTTAWGGALSTFGQDFDQHGAPIINIFEYQTLGSTMHDIVRSLKIPQPQFLKIDVDGIEHFILRGGCDILANVDGVLVEINDNFFAQAEESARYLQNAGLVLIKKCDLGVPSHYNQLWIRPVTDKSERI